jgi:hypothetical protein
MSWFGGPTTPLINDSQTLTSLRVTQEMFLPANNTSATTPNRGLLVQDVNTNSLVLGTGSQRTVVSAGSFTPVTASSATFVPVNGSVYVVSTTSAPIALTIQLASVEALNLPLGGILQFTVWTQTNGNNTIATVTTSDPVEFQVVGSPSPIDVGPSSGGTLDVYTKTFIVVRNAANVTPHYLLMTPTANV